MNMASTSSPRLQVLQTTKDDPTCQTFLLQGEGDTLGNALSYIIMKNPYVQFCSFAVPHPSEDKIYLRIQTYGVPARDILRQGLVELQKVCQHVRTTFEAEVSTFKERKKMEEG